jgi:hypothetical protein
LRWLSFFLASLLNGAVVEGTAVNAVTGAPVARAKLTLHSGDRIVYSAVADEQGRAMAPDVADGSYRVQWEAAGFVAPPMGAPLLVAAGSAPVRIRVELKPYGGIAGTVAFGDGEPAAGVQVELYGVTRRGVQRVRTGSDGRFEFASVAPGSYQLGARPGRPKMPAVAPVDGQAFAWITTFAPGVAERSAADRIAVRPGAVVQTGIRFLKRPVYRVRGTVVNETGQPVAGVPVRLGHPDPWIVSDLGTKSHADGSFELPVVPDGDWRLHAEGVGRKGFTNFHISGRDVDRIEVRMELPFQITGRVDRDDLSKATAIYLLPADGMLERRTEAFHKPDGSFVLDRVLPGRYRITPLGYMPGYYVDSVLLGDRDVLTEDVDLFPGAPPVRIVYKPNAGRASGTVDKGKGSTVVFLPKDEALMDGQFIRTARCGEDGRFQLHSLRPGSYSAFAFDRIEFDLLENPEFVRSFANRGVTVQIRQGETASVDLRVTAWPEY